MEAKCLGEEAFLKFVLDLIRWIEGLEGLEGDESEEVENFLGLTEVAVAVTGVVIDVVIDVMTGVSTVVVGLEFPNALSVNNHSSSDISVVVTGIND